MHDSHDDVLDEQACKPNTNICLVAGEMAELTIDQKGMARFILRYEKSWPNGKTSLLTIPCASKAWPGAADGHVVVIRGEIQSNDQGLSVYAHQVEDLSEPRKAGRR